MKDFFYYRNLLKQVVKEEFIDNWLDTLNPAFENRAPRSLIYEGEGERIEMMVYQIADGVAG